MRTRLTHMVFQLAIRAPAKIKRSGFILVFLFCRATRTEPRRGANTVKFNNLYSI